MRNPRLVILAIALVFIRTQLLRAQNAITATRGTVPNLVGHTDQPLRYLPDRGDFVIENGGEFFNRPLYGRNTAFRVDAGDKPEFTLYLPGRGGNLRLGIKSGSGSKWLADAARVIARYRPGEMLYEIRDPLLGPAGVLRLTVFPMHATDGLLVRAEAQSVPEGIELVWAYGGVNGQRGSRDGDIGTERVPISEYFQLKPEFCQNNLFTLSGRTFTLKSQPATIVGIAPEGATLAIADAAHWSSFEELLASASPSSPALAVLIGRIKLQAATPLFIALQRVADGAVPVEELNTYREVTAGRAGVSTQPSEVTFLPPYRPEEIPRVFEETEAVYRALRERVSVDTPDTFINAAVGALDLAADAVWDDSENVVMHGAIAWRSKLLGWRGPYSMDALGWHDRARQHLTYWATRQNTDPIPDKLPPADADQNLSRSEKALHSNGDISNSHYDMNAVYIDALFRHLLWTGDLEFAKQVWPVIERHLAWERRLFRREFGPERLPLYEAYAQIWASDDLEYGGGGVSYASAYNYFHNVMAARVAKLLGHDPTPYETEAVLIAKAMRQYLWIEDRGGFAEFKDLLGNQLVHPSAGLWSFYHTMDSGLPTREESLRMVAAVERSNPHLPVEGPGVPVDLDYHVLSSTDWMPYTWSANNVVMGENIHTALGYWQAGRAEEAFLLAKSALLASMYMGICPGNVGSMNYLDVYRRESQRDFGDGSGVLSRAIVEGLFGVRPDALAGEMRISPGFPVEWSHARLSHPDINLTFTNSGQDERWTISRLNSAFKTVSLRIPASMDHIAWVRVNGVETAWSADTDAVGRPYAQIVMPASPSLAVVIRWTGETFPPPNNLFTPSGRFERVTRGEFSWWASIQSDRKTGAAPSGTAGFDWKSTRTGANYEAIDLSKLFNDRVTEIFKRGKYVSPRSPFVSLSIPAQGIGAWAGHVTTLPQIDDSGLRKTAGDNGGKLMMPNGVPFAAPGPGDARNILFTSQWDNYPHDATIPLLGKANHVYLLMAGSTNHMQSRIDNGEVIVTYADGTTARLALENPTNWWPIDQDYFTDDYQFRRTGPIPPRINLRSGEIRILDEKQFKGRGGNVNGGAATALDLPLDPNKELRSLTVRTIANEVVIGVMSVTLERP